MTAIISTPKGVMTDKKARKENVGGEVLVVKGSEENIKLTTPVDVILAESILKNRIKNGNF